MDGDNSDNSPGLIMVNDSPRMRRSLDVDKMGAADSGSISQQ